MESDDGHDDDQSMFMEARRRGVGPRGCFRAVCVWRVRGVEYGF